MVKLSTIDEHQSTVAMSSNTSSMGLQLVSTSHTSHSLWVGDDMGMPIEIFVGVFL